jgi:LuxR family transcriptional regulator, maltose regulon positive regulatory protein
LIEAESRGHRRRLNEILVLMAIAHEAAGAADLALDCLERSLKSAEPEGFMRVYLDEGLPVVKLLREAARRGVESQYCARLLREFQRPKQTRPLATIGIQSVLIEPLSERELEILQLLAEGYANREIGDRLYISLSTVKGHISNIFGKLPAKNRTEAVARARQLGILPEN